MGDGSLTFVVPVRDSRGVPAWDAVKQMMARTLGSLHNAGGHIVVAANRGTDLPELPPGADLVQLDFEYTPLPDVEGPARLAAVRRDKGLRVASGLVATRPQGHVMVVDYDDFVSSRLAGLARAKPDAPGWFVDEGYLYDGGPLVMLRKGFDRVCGTSLIVRADLLPIQRSLGEADLEQVDRALGSHMYIRGDLYGRGTPLEPTPFPGAVYRIGHAESTSPTQPRIGRRLSPRRAIRHPRSWFQEVGRLRRSRSIRQEFGIA